MRSAFKRTPAVWATNVSKRLTCIHQDLRSSADAPWHAALAETCAQAFESRCEVRCEQVSQQLHHYICPGALVVVQRSHFDTSPPFLDVPPRAAVLFGTSL